MYNWLSVCILVEFYVNKLYAIHDIHDKDESQNNYAEEKNPNKKRIYFQSREFMVLFMFMFYQNKTL